jgi:hypothetical protein
MRRSRKRNTPRAFESPDGARWDVEVPATLAGASNAMVIFHHPNGATARLDRYAWYLADSPEARSVTGHLDADAVLKGISDEELALLFRRSMLISAADNPLNIPITHAG